ncbi:MAG: CvpA family protein [Candidatus Eisenbacteria bacterium]|nr:CvpA family protein [Candidatus Eisenbacteria bacterium]
MDAHWADLVIGAVLLVLFLRGLFRGLVKELFALAAILAGWLVATRYHLAVGSLVGVRSDGEALLARAILFALVFLVTAVLVRLIGHAVHKVLSDSPLGWLNRLLGGAVGVAFGVILIGVILLVIVTYLPAGGRVLEGSSLVGPITRVTRVLAKTLPDEASELFDRNFRGKHPSIPEDVEGFV